MDARTPMPRLTSRPHVEACTILSVGTPTLIAVALRAGRRGAGPAELARRRAMLAALAERDPAAALVVTWLDAKLGLAVPDADPGSSSSAEDEGENAGAPSGAGAGSAGHRASRALVGEVHP